MSYMLPIEINPDLQERAKKYIPKNPLGFGQQIAPLGFSCVFKNNSWQKPELINSDHINISPAAKVFHYGQAIFEGMKAYRHNDGEPLLFRPDINFNRFNDSARRMAMPNIPEEIFMGGIERLVSELSHCIPQKTGESLYLRPFMIATEPGLSVAMAHEYLFVILASPSGSYFSTSKVSALIERKYSRASPGGTGNVKVAGNYGSSIISSLRAKENNYQQTLWLDAVDKKYIEEFSGMNFFALVDNVLITPKLNDSILPGVTRQSLITLAEKKSIKVCSTERIHCDELVEKIKNGSCTEIFACGTAATLSPIAELGELDGTRYKLCHPEGKLALELREELLQIQLGLVLPPEDNWVYKVQTQ